MGYRLEISKVEYQTSGGKLFGYIEDEELHKCKSWQWLRDRNYVDTENDIWGYGYEHTTLLAKEDYRQFIQLYIEDYNKYQGLDLMKLEDFEETLKSEYILLEWW